MAGKAWSVVHGSGGEVMGRRERRHSSDIVVVGGGVVGCAVSYYAARIGLRVCLLERGPIGGGTSGASAGQTSVQARAAGPPLELALASVQLLDELSRELSVPFEYVKSGCVVLAEDDTEHQLLRRFVERQSTHIPVQFLEAEDLRKAEPHLNPRFLGGSYCPLDGYVNPIALTRALAEGARALGARVLPHTAATGFEVNGGHVTAVRTANEVYEANAVVVAAGVWSTEICGWAGVDVSVVPRRGQVVVTEAVPVLMTSWLTHAGFIPYRDHGIDVPPGIEGELQKKRYMKQVKAGGFQGRVYVGSTSEFVGFNKDTTGKAIGEMCQYAVDTVPALRYARVVRTWAGLRPRSADGKFLIGEAPSAKGLFIATGHDSTGVQYSSVTGKLLAEWIHTGKRPRLLEAFDPTRPSAVADRAEKAPVTRETEAPARVR